MQKAIDYIEEHIYEDIDIKDISTIIGFSQFHFQKGFAMLSGYTIGEYIRMRRLTLAGIELMMTNAKIIDIAFKYCYDSPDSFAKAFKRFHGIQPSIAKQNEATLKSFAPLQIKFSLDGGYLLDYRIENKEELTLIGKCYKVDWQTSYAMIPNLWQEHNSHMGNDSISGYYGISIGSKDNDNTFDYYIADIHDGHNEEHHKLIVNSDELVQPIVIPAYTWAVFPCHGPLPNAMQEVNTKIYSQWLPNCKDYDLATPINIEMYDDIGKYQDGIKSDDYYSELWIPIKKKEGNE